MTASGHPATRHASWRVPYATDSSFEEIRMGQPQPDQPNQPPYQQPMPPPQIVPAGPRKSVTKPKTSLFDWFMLVMTCGLWYPVVWLKKRRKTTVTTYRY